MKVLLLLAAVGIGLAAAGVIHFQKNGDNVDISIDETKLKQTTAKVVQEGEHFLSEAEQSIGQPQPQSFGQQMESDIKTQAQRLAPAHQ